MSVTLLTILLVVVGAQIGVVIIYHQNAGQKRQQMQYQYGLEALKLEKRLEALQQSVLSYHDKIDEIRIKIDEMQR